MSPNAFSCMYCTMYTFLFLHTDKTKYYLFIRKERLDWKWNLASVQGIQKKVQTQIRCERWHFLWGFLEIIRVIIAESFIIIPFIKLLVSEYDMHRYIASTISKDKKLRKYSSKDPNQMWMHSKLSYSSCVACCVMALYVLSTLL